MVDFAGWSRLVYNCISERLHINLCVCVGVCKQLYCTYQVHKRTHADLLWREDYDTLYSTRHYGPYLWFLVSKHQLEGVLKYFLTTEKLAILYCSKSDTIILYL